MTMTNQEAIAVLRNINSDFAQSLCKSWDRDRISEKQLFWVHKLAGEAANPMPREYGVPHMDTLATLMEGTGNKYPKIVFRAGDRDVRVSRFGPGSRNHGDLKVVDNDNWADGQYGPYRQPLGRVHGSTFEPSRYFNRLEKVDRDDILDTLKLVLANPKEELATLGKLAGNCCFCHKEITTEESLDAGYGPECAKKWGLPWG